MYAELPEAFRGIFKPARFKAYYGGRGSGKSHSLAIALVLLGVKRSIRWLCAREIQKSLQTSVKQLLEDKIIALKLQDAYVITSESITGKNGTKFFFVGLKTNPDSIKSMEGLDGVWVEEADRCSQRSLDLLLPTIRKPNSELWFSWNRYQATDPVDNMFLGGKPPPNSIVQQVNWRDNPFFPEVLKGEMLWLKERDVDKWRHVWEGGLLQQSNAKVFSNWRVDDLDDHIPEGSIPRLGADWGFSVDPTVIVECHVFNRTLYFKEEAYKVKCEVDETPALFYGSDRRKPPRWTNVHAHPGLESVRRDYRIVADSARPETISYMSKRGFNIVRANKGQGSVEDGLEFMRTYDIVLHPRCTNLKYEMSVYSYKVDSMTEMVLPFLKDAHNNVIDAARYSLEGVRRAHKARISIVGPTLVQV